MSDSIKELQAQFEHGWTEISLVYAFMLSKNTLKVAKGIAWNTYIRGRTDEMARQLKASQATVILRQLKRDEHAPVE